MSQVIVTSDSLKSKREKTKTQEQKIDCDGFLKKWKMSDPTRPDPVAKIVGVLILPVIGIWTFLASLTYLAIQLSIYTCKFLGSFFKKSKEGS